MAKPLPLLSLVKSRRARRNDRIATGALIVMACGGVLLALGLAVLQ